MHSSSFGIAVAEAEATKSLFGVGSIAFLRWLRSLLVRRNVFNKQSMCEGEDLMVERTQLQLANETCSTLLLNTDIRPQLITVLKFELISTLRCELLLKCSLEKIVPMTVTAQTNNVLGDHVTFILTTITRSMATFRILNATKCFDYLCFSCGGALVVDTSLVVVVAAATLIVGGSATVNGDQLFE